LFKKTKNIFIVFLLFSVLTANNTPIFDYLFKKAKAYNYTTEIPALAPINDTQVISESSVTTTMAMVNNLLGFSVEISDTSSNDIINFSRPEDKQLINNFNNYFDKMQEAGYNFANSTDSNSVVKKENYLIGIASAAEATPTPPKIANSQVVLDKRIVNVLNYLTKPKSAGGEEQDYVNVAKMVQNQRLSTDNLLAEERSDENPISKHYYDGVQAVQIAGKDNIKCTMIERDSNTCQIVNKKALKQIPIDFINLKENTSNPTDSGNGSGISNTSNAGKALGNNFHQFLTNTTSGITQQLITGNLAGLTTSTANLIPNSRNIGDVLANTGSGLVLDAFELPIPNTQGQFGFGSTINDTVEKFGRAGLEKIFNGALPQESFVGPTYEDWIQNIGKRTLEEKFNLPSGSFDNQGINLTNTGKRWIEQSLGISLGSLDKTATGKNELIEQIGAGKITNALNFPIDSYTSNSLNDIKKAVGGEELYNQKMSDLGLVALELGINKTDLESRLSNPQSLKSFVGQAVLDQNINIYQNYQTASGKIINSADWAYGLNIFAPYIDYDKKIIITYNYTPGQGVLKSEYPFDSGSSLYEDLVATQESTIAQFAAGNNLDSIYKKIGNMAFSQSISSNKEDQIALYNWFENPNNFPKNSDGTNVINTESLAANYGLEKYDFARFIQGLSYDVYNRIGSESLINAMNPSADSVLEDNDLSITTDNYTEFLNTKLDEITNGPLKNISEPAKSDIAQYINTIKNAKENSVDDVMKETKENLISSSMFNIEKTLKTNNIYDSKQGIEISQILSEIIAEQSFTEPKDLVFSNSETMMQFDIALKDITDFLSQNSNDLNIDDLKQDVGKKIMASFLNTTPEKITQTMQKSSNLGSINATSQIIGDSLSDTAAQFNTSLGKSDFTKDNLVSILSGVKTPLIKISGTSLADNLSFSSQDILSLAQGNYSTIVDKIDTNKLLSSFGMEDADDTTKTNITSALTAMTKPGANLVEVGINWLPSFINTEPTTDNTASSSLSFSASMNQAVLAGQMTNPVLNDISNSAKPLTDSFTESALIHTNLHSTMASQETKIMADFIKNEFPDSTDLPKLKENLRFLSGITKPNGLQSFVEEKFSDYLSKLSSEQKDPMVKTLMSGIGLNMFTGGINQSVMFSKVDAILHNADKNIPAGFAKAMFSGDSAAIATAGKDFLINKISLSNNENKSILIDILNNYNSDNIASILANNERINELATEQLQNIFGDNFPANGTTPILQALTGNTDALVNAGIGEAKDYLTQIMDVELFRIGAYGQAAGTNTAQMAANLGITTGSSLGGTTGATAAINNTITNQNSKTDDFLKNAGLGKLDKLLDTKNLLQGLKMQLVGIITSMLTPVLSSIESQLGLPSGMLTGVFNAYVASLFIPGFNVVVAIAGIIVPTLLQGVGLGFIGNFIGGIIGGINPLGGGKKQEVWCAMDYYPYLEKEITYDISFEPSFDQIENNGLENMKPLVGDNAGTVANSCSGGTVSENHGKGEFKMVSQSTLKGKLKLAARFKNIQLLGELLRMPEKLDNKDMLPRQIRTMLKETYNPYIGKLDKLYGITKINTETGKLELVKGYRQRILDNDTLNGVWADERYPNMYIGY